jgi:membrane-associated phospholipid phosphatase
MATTEIYTWAGQAPPTWPPMAMLALVAFVGLSRRIYRLERPWSDVLASVWPVFLSPLVYLSEVRLLEASPGRYVDHLLAPVDARLGITETAQSLWLASGLVQEVVNLLYASYYVIPVVVVVLAVRVDALAGARATTALVLTSLICGLLWIGWPSGGYFPGGSPMIPAAGPFTAFMNAVYGFQPHFAAAFPSEHVAHAAALTGILRARGHGRWLWLWVAGVGLATVFGGYHYALDGLAGLAAGMAAARFVNVLQDLELGAAHSEGRSGLR